MSLDGDLSVQVDYLSGAVQANPPATSASIEQLDGFEVVVQSAKLKVPESSLLPMVQKELDRINAPLKLEKAQVRPQGLYLTGKILRHGQWLPFAMNGKPLPARSSQIEMTPDAMTMRGVDLVPALIAANVHFTEILDLRSPAFRFNKRTMILDLERMLPSPKVNFSIASMELAEGFILVNLGQTAAPASMLKCTSDCPTSYVVTNGGNLEAMGITLSNTPTLLTTAQAGRLSLSLSEIRPLLMSSQVRLREDGALWVSIDSDLPAVPEEDPRLRNARKALQENGLLSSPDDLILIARNSRLVTPAGVSVDIHSLVSTAQGAQLEALPTLAQNALMGKVALTFPSLDNLMNRVTFFYDGSPVRKVSTRRGEGEELVISMKVKPHLGPLPLIWSPTTMSGSFSVSEDQTELLFSPRSIKVFGINVKGLLSTLGMELDDMVSIDRPDVQLKGNLLHLKVGSAIPPLTLETKIQTVGFGQGLHGEPAIALNIGTANDALRTRMDEEMRSIKDGLWMDAAALQAYGMQIRHSLAHVRQTGDKPLTIELANYPKVLETGYMRLTHTGLVEVTLPAPYNTQ